MDNYTYINLLLNELIVENCGYDITTMDKVITEDDINNFNLIFTKWLNKK